MKNLLKFVWVLVLAPILFLNSCTDYEDIPGPQDRFGVLKTYLIDNNMDLSVILTDWITTAENVYTTMTDADATNDYYIIDIRAEEHYDEGHIEWAVNATLGGILEAAQNAGGKPIIVACYSGQGAGHAVVALRLSGYPDAKVMKWGMCSWNEATATSWTNGVGDAAIGNANWSNPPGDIQANTPHDAPVIEYLESDPAVVLSEQVAKMLAGGFSAVSNESVLGTPTDYFINNFWAIGDIEHYGNISTAYQVKPLTLASGEYVYLDPAGKVVTYCWTGQTSSIVTAYLTVIGYEAYSLTFGTNGMIYSNLESHKWSEAQIMGYPLAQ
ncbi:MAG: hypothetical protein K8R41_11005 [Bacteroidales bacterium]|nr:hypothetical protein [Bacteroidales bacterium]